MASAPAPVVVVPVNTSATSYIVSPTMTTPRPMTATLQPQSFVIPSFDQTTPRKDDPQHRQASIPAAENGHIPGGKGSNVPGASNGYHGDVHAEDETEGLDGRVTPLASESSRLSQSGSSGPSDPQPVSPQSLSAVPSSSSLAPSLVDPSAQAEVGLCSLATERQIREAATGKDRMFLLLLSQEIEAYIVKITIGDYPSFVLPQGTLSNSILATLAHAFPLATVTTSKYQRMLVYKVAEWYGLKAVAGPDGLIFIGVLGSLDDKSASLRLADIAPKPPSPKQNFKIMQRVPLGSGGPGSSRGGSVFGDDSSEAGTSKRKTLEEREAEYALARERIYGRDDAGIIDGPADDDEIRRRSRQPTNADEEIDPVPRHNFGPNGVAIQPVYASLYNPPKPSASPSPSVQSMHSQGLQYQSPDTMFAYQQNMAFPPYGHMPMDAFPGSSAYAHVPNGQFPGQPQLGYIDPQYMVPQTAYDAQPWQGPPVSGRQHQPNGQPPVTMPQISPGWSYNGVPMMHPPQPMPMIPQGVPAFQPSYGFHQQQQQPMYAPLVQPTPQRPGPIPHTHPHSSNSSSISSRSYQDYSRPHSRGSTTSTRSAASSVRLGHMFPAGQPGYRQKGMKGQGVNGMTSLGIGERRSTRGHSPSSTTTTSSRSSRRAPSINLQAPQAGQHQLPQKPDWAANNIPYHPSPLPLQFQPGHMLGGPSNSDFPPLLRNGTNAEPMQVERARMRPPNGTVWNGSVGGKAVHHSPSLPQQQQYQQTNSFIPGHHQPAPPVPSLTPQPLADTDPDFPRRSTSNRNASTLFDPSATKPDAPSSPSTAGLSVEDIEARLAVLSVTSGIAIGPAPTKTPSYAKIVRRD